MSGFDTSRPGIVAMAKQFGSILRGFGPPVPQAGVTGDLYIDNQTFQLFEKREINGLDPWGHYLFTIPLTYRFTLKWFGSSAPDNMLGIPGDYFLQWAGYDNYGMQPTIWGPKLISGWPENGDGGSTTISPNSTGVLQLGVSDQGTYLTDIALTQLIATGLFDDYIIPIPITANPGDVVTKLGVASTGTLLLATINPLYTAEDEYALQPV